MIAQPAIEVPPMLNMDYAQRLVIPTRQVNWQPSPMSGVMRKRMAYEKVESGHATSIVEFRAGSSFRSHGHPGGGGNPGTQGRVFRPVRRLSGRSLPA